MLKILVEFLRYLENGIPVRVFTGSPDLFAGHLVSTFLPGYPGEVNLMFGIRWINHQQLNQVFVQFCRQAFLADWAMKIEWLTFLKLKSRMLDT